MIMIMENVLMTYESRTQFHNVKVVVAHFNQEKA